MANIKSPFVQFYDIDGQPLEDGYIYIGTAGLDPATNAITVYSDADLATTVTQPVRTIGGFPVVSGSPVRLYVGAVDFSIRVSNKNNTQIHQDLNFGEDGFGGDVMFVDSANDRVGIGTSSPAQALDVNGSINVADNQYLGCNGNLRTSLQLSETSDFAVFRTDNVERLRIDSSGNVLVGKTSTSGSVSGFSVLSSGQVSSVTDGITPLILNRQTNDGIVVNIQQDNALEGNISVSGTQIQLNGSGSLGLQTGGTTRATIDSSGNLLVGKTVAGIESAGAQIDASGIVRFTVDGNIPLNINRKTDDGTLCAFYQDNALEGNISVSGTTVSYNGGHLARWSRTADNSKPANFLKGTVMSNLDQMVEWAYPETPEELWQAGDGLPEGVSVGDVKVEYKPAGVEDNEQLNCVELSSVEGDKNVAGVFVSWDESDDYNDMNLAMTGDFIIRIAQGTTVHRGDLLMSAGDGTAKPQTDDAVRSCTIAKVTSTHVSHTYDDGSYCVPCVLMAC